MNMTARVNRIFLILFFAFFFLQFCEKEMNEEAYVELQVDCSKAELFLSDRRFIRDISYIPLETQDGNYLDEIDGLRIFGDYLFFIENESLNNKVISVYDKKGKGVIKILSPGQGPGSFSSVYDLWYDEKNSAIELLDANSGKIVRYSLEGKYINDINLPGQFQEFVKFKDGNYALYSGFTPQNSGMFNFCHFNDGILQNCALKFPTFFVGNKMEGPHFSSSSIDHNNYLLHDSFNDTIYQFNNHLNSFSPAYRLDLGSNWIDDKWISDFANGDMRTKMFLMNRSGFVNSFLHAQEEENILSVAFRNSTERRRYFYFYNINSSNSKLFYAQSPQSLGFTSNDYDQGPITSNFLAREGDVLYFLIEASDFIYHFDRNVSESTSDLTSKRYKEIKEGISDNIDEKDNPIIMKVQVDFKEI